MSQTLNASHGSTYPLVGVYGRWTEGEMKGAGGGVWGRTVVGMYNEIKKKKSKKKEKFF